MPRIITQALTKALRIIVKNPSIGGSCAFSVQTQFRKSNCDGTRGDQAVCQIENGEGPAGRVKQDIVDDMSIDETVDDIADGPGHDHAETEMHEAVRITDGRKALEVSGSVILGRLAAIAARGVDFVSVGAITKHIHAIDFSMRLGEPQ